MAAVRSPERGQLWKVFGAPARQVGSVNDPRTQEECGVKWNEKWIYHDPEDEGWDRWVLWNRYDFQGLFRVKPAGSHEPEPLPEK